MMASSLVPGCLVMSDLLTIRERGILFTLLPPRCTLIKTTVAQVLEARDQAPGWTRVGCGVVCLLQDESVHAFFLRLYCVKRAQLLWEQELYVPFKYTASRAFFHTFPADGFQVGFNFADETEAKEFELSVKAAQGQQEKFMTDTETETETVNAPESRAECFLVESPVSVSPPASSSFKDLDLDPAIRRLLLQAKLPVEELRDKDVAEAVDCIIARFGGLKAVQGALRGRGFTGLASQTLPRSAGASISTALRKGPLPPVPPTTSSFTSFTSSLQAPPGPGEVDQLHIPPPPAAPAPALPERLRKSTSFKYTGSSADRDRSDLILAALRKVLIEKQLRSTSPLEGNEDLSPTHEP